MQRLLERGPQIERRRLDLRAQSAGRAQTVQVQREAVAQIQGRRRVDLLAKKATERQARLWPFMPLPRRAPMRLQSASRSAELPRYINRVPRARPVAPQ